MYNTPSFRTVLKTARFPPGSVGACVAMCMDMLDEHKNGLAAVSILPLLIAIHKESGGLFVPGEQYDLCELWVWMVDRMHIECAVTQLDPPSSFSAMDRDVKNQIHKYQAGKYSSILDHVQAAQIAVVECKHCHYKVFNVEPYSVITLNIGGAEENETLPELLKQHLGSSSMCDWACDSCTQKGGSRVVRFYDLPKLLVIALNRFYYASDRLRMGKLQDPILITKTLCFDNGSIVSDMATQPINYRLCAAGNHFGGYGEGHYTASIFDEATETWHHMDDGNVLALPCPPQTIHRDAYMLFYERDSTNVI